MYIVDQDGLLDIVSKEVLNREKKRIKLESPSRRGCTENPRVSIVILAWEICIEYPTSSYESVGF